ncbi:hypothetical protein PAAG_08780 [Paracoccidioides lutzii Pb01]|uniref:Uncharacterized protein n=1 Tax=Paracoccidioides lutzii (strain ATCC MYA-826 / Pb01) TaxID=502779 RepID=C1HDD9_PARBA|nr:hypothetical protein PAAG_08780 [Paracoccidioides lutzii Pb01]EEH39511.2 hypothetical protein PAAG_08780 [Paracoccidioides lutzii Pb01]
MLLPFAKLLTLTLAFVSATAAIPVENQSPEKKQLETRAKKDLKGKMVIACLAVSAGKTRQQHLQQTGPDVWPDVYTTPIKEQVKARKGEWKVLSPSKTTWKYCVVQAEKAAMERVAKFWVPQKREHKRLWEKTNNNPYLWYQGEQSIISYSVSKEPSWMAFSTLRLSIVAKKYDTREKKPRVDRNTVQMCIPAWLMNQ